MTGKEKLYFLLDTIDDARTIAPSGQPVLIHPLNDLNNRYSRIELTQLFTKLEKDEQVLKVLRVPPRMSGIFSDLDPYSDPSDGCYHLEVFATFDKYYSKIQQEPEYQKFTSKKPSGQKVQKKVQPKYSRKALEKIWDVLQEIEEKRQLRPEGDEIQIPKYPYGSNLSNWDDYHQERKAILPKLVSLGAIKDLREGKEGAWQFWGFHIGNRYFDVFSEHEEEYKKIVKDYEQAKQMKKIKIKNPVYEVKYSEKTREILINNFLIAKPDFFRENEVVFTYIYKHPNERLSKDRIEKENGIKLTKTLPKILENLGFTGETRKAFFDVSSKGALFRNPVTRKDLDELGIKYLRLK